MYYREEEARQLIIKAGLMLVEEGLVARTWGNISARISEDTFLITPSGIAYDRLQPEDLVKVTMPEMSYEGNRKPSSEKGIHKESYSLRKDISFIIHTHQKYATAAGFLKAPFPVAAYGISSTKKLTQNVKEAVASHPEDKCFIMKAHGAMILGESFEEAFELAKEMEDICKEMVEPILWDVCSKYSDIQDYGEWIANETGLGDYVVKVSTKETMYISSLKSSLRPMLDDMAQMAGTKIPVISSDFEKANESRKNRVVFLKDWGALCFGVNEEEAMAAAIVLQKDCISRIAGWENGEFGLGFFDCKLQHLVYEKKYAKLKNQ